MSQDVAGLLVGWWWALGSLAWSQVPSGGIQWIQWIQWREVNTVDTVDTVEGSEQATNSLNRGENTSGYNTGNTRIQE